MTEITAQVSLFDLVDQQEKEAENERSIRRVQESYRKWLHTPQLTESNESVFDYGVHNGIIHLCEKMPKDIYLWRNATCYTADGGEFWTKQSHKHYAEVERVEKCPYCGADVKHGEGVRYLRRAYGTIYAEKSYRRYYRLDEIDRQERGKVNA